MKNKIYTTWLQKCLCTLVLSFFVFNYLGNQASFFQNNVKNIAFDAATKIIFQSDTQETRITADGNIIQRFFTGLKNTPYFDYLVLTNKEGKTSFMPIRENSFFFQKQTPTFETISLLKEATFFTKAFFIKLLLSSVLLLFVLNRIVFFERPFFLLYSKLSREKIWLKYNQLRL